MLIFLNFLFLLNSLLNKKEFHDTCGQSPPIHFKTNEKENVQTGNVETGTVQPFKPIIFQWSFEHLKHV
uniref:Uncharacterized protein n=1 Tax=Anguilla anguilla TaxID=7936 RepID=A0A0E9QNX7_ANGAN